MNAQAMKDTWCKTHENQLEKFEYTYKALEFIREKQKNKNLDEIE